MEGVNSNTSDLFLAGGGEMGALIRSMDWSQTPLGPIQTWPQSLRTSVSLCLSSTFPILIAWGPETIQLYNDSYRPICGAKHPESMGQNFRICWETALPVVGDAFTRGQLGEGTYIQDQRMFLDRYGYLEEAFMTFSFAPIRDESGNVGGIFHPITETTDKMLSARRTQVLRDIAVLTGQAKTYADLYSGIANAPTDFSLDLPFLFFYELLPDAQRASLMTATGLPADELIRSELEVIDVAQTPWLSDLTQLTVVTRFAHTVGLEKAGPYPELPQTAVLLPIRFSGQERPFGFLIAGVSPRRELDTDYLNFYALLGNTINTAFSNVHAYQQEQKRAEALAAIDRVKTAFFSNISHEFRTPLTLMLGPLEELLQNPSVQASDFRQPIETSHRNAQRLLKLVNNLLDFSRIEAGRVQARFRPLDLVRLTVDLSSSFRSLLEKAGLQFVVECHPLSKPVYADAEMWEKIVLNLLSNAFKFTLQGTIRVRLSAEGNEAILRISDTGVGIPENELPHMFERFHRVENSAGRSHEGTGIGLSLVSELVHLHHGTIEVASELGIGSTFTVRLPLGKSHLPASQVIEQESGDESFRLTDAFLQEARTMLSDAEDDAFPTGWVSESVPTEKSTTILIVDDNSDMRAYLTRLLEPYFTVHTAFNGVDALNQLGHTPVQLILSDVMMPVMDGKELLTQIRKNSATNHIPLIFLSARAGQEARIDGLEAGADDYLVKPFSGSELLTKIRVQVNLSQTRRQAETRLRNLVQQAPVAMLLVKGENLVIELINQAMLEMINRNDAVLGQPLLSVMPELNELPIVAECRLVYQTGQPYQGWAVPALVNRNGQVETGFFNVAYTPFYENGVRTGVMQVVTEVTEQVQTSLALAESEAQFRQLSADLDEQVQLRTQQLQASIQDLQRSNQNLQQFAYIASHDLQEPLRKIQSFAELLKTQYATPLGAGVDYLERMQSAAGRMSALIRDLLSFSRISTQQNTTAAIPLTEVISQVLTNLELSIRESQAQVVIEALPTVKGDRTQLEQLFQNLISNGLKFRRPQIPARIEVRAHRVAAQDLPPTVRPTRSATVYHCIEVVDNGIGFDEKYLDRIFQVFQRLHGKSEFAGTGIGLAICEKVAANHGGAITARSRSGLGATFSVYLPA